MILHVYSDSNMAIYATQDRIHHWYMKWLVGVVTQDIETLSCAPHWEIDVSSEQLYVSYE